MTTWVLAALNSIEPHVQNLAQLAAFHSGEQWAAARRPQLEDMVRKRLESLSFWLRDRDWLEGQFTAGDLIMATVLRELENTDELARDPIIDAYFTRCTARPAFRRALDSQMRVFRDNEPPVT